MNISELRIALKYPNMTIRQLAVLLMLAAGKIKSRDVATQLHIPRPSICRAFDTLTNLKLMTRFRDENGDMRDVFGVLTPKGIALAEELMK